VSRRDRGLPPWSSWVVVVIVLLALFASTRIDSGADEKVKYSEFLTSVEDGKVDTATWDNATAKIAEQVGFPWALQVSRRLDTLPGVGACGEYEEYRFFGREHHVDAMVY